MKKWKLGVIIGTRPEILKTASIIKEIRKNPEFDIVLIHSGQHYDYEMAQSFYKELNLPEPDYCLSVPPEGNSLEKVSMIMQGLKQVFKHHSFCGIVVQGDTHTAMIGGIASVILDIPVFHVEAGCRSFDRSMPEEINRIILDHIASLLFAPTKIAERNLLNEGIYPKRIKCVGNTLDDVLPVFLSSNPENFISNIPKSAFCLVTIHRKENTDSKEILTRIFRSLIDLNLPVVIPLHPRTKKRLNEFEMLSILDKENLVIVPPMKYSEFLYFLSRANIIITDSGGVQTEAAAIGTPCVTLRKTTEWPETVWSGLNVLCDPVEGDILSSVFKQFKKGKKGNNKVLKSPKISQKIVKELIHFIRNPLPLMRVDVTKEGCPILQESK